MKCNIKIQRKYQLDCTLWYDGDGLCELSDEYSFAILTDKETRVRPWKDSICLR